MLSCVGSSPNVLACFCGRSCRMIDNTAARVMWRTYCNAERVGAASFVEAVRLFLLHHLDKPEAFVQEALSPGNVTALCAAVDANEDGMVGAKGPASLAA